MSKKWLKSFEFIENNFELWYLGYKLQKCNNFKVHTLLQLQPFIDRANSGQLTTYSECTFCKLWQKLQIYFEHIQIPYNIGFLTNQLRYFKNLKSYRIFDLRFLVFCFDEFSDLLWEKIVLVIEKNFWMCKNFANSLPSASNFKTFSQTLEHFFLTVGQNNFDKKIPFLMKIYCVYMKLVQTCF